MNPVPRTVVFALLPLAFCFPARAEKPAAPTAVENLNYTVNWPSGLSLGEGHLQAKKTAGRWEYDFTLEAAVPGFAVADHYHSAASPELCSLEYEKDATHGKRLIREKTVFDYKKSVGRRATVGGGKSEFSIPSCARDALTYLFFVRRELAEGRMPSPATVFWGASYQVRMEYTGAQTIPLGDARREAERVVVSVKGPSADVSFEMFFARDAARTPLLVRCPFALGTFTLELVR